MNDLLIVTVAFRSDDDLPVLLTSIERGTASSARVVVVDNGPEPSSVPEPGTDRVMVEQVPSHDNPGYGSGVNRGAATAHGERWLLVVNPDVRFEPGSIDELINRARAIEGVGMAGPQIRTPIGEVYPSARRLPSLRSGVGHALFSRTWRSNPWTRRYLADRELPPRERPAGWLSGACFAMPIDVFERVGGFDESYFMYFEDVDLAARVAAAGYQVIYVPSAVVVHTGGASTGTSNRQMIIAHHRSAYLYLSRRYRAWYLAPVRWILRLGLAIRSRIVQA